MTPDPRNDTTADPASAASSPADARWHFLRDALVFQFKLLLGNVQNLLLVPVAAIAVLIDLVFARSPQQGARFYKVLHIARDIDEGIDLYSPIGGYHAKSAAVQPATTASSSDPLLDPIADIGARTGSAVDKVVRGVEDAIVREYRKGGTAASLKAAVDRVLDELQREARKKD